MHLLQSPLRPTARRVPAPSLKTASHLLPMGTGPHNYHTTPRAGRGEELRPRAELRRRLFTSSHSADGTCTCLVHTERCSSAARINSIIAHFQGLFRSTLCFTQLVHERTHCLDFCRNIGGCQGALRIIVHDWQHKQAGLTRLAAAYRNAVLRKPSWRWRAASNAKNSS